MTFKCEMQDILESNHADIVYVFRKIITDV